MNKIPIIASTLILLCLAFFSIFGFLASFELAAAEALPWKISYGILLTGCLAGVLSLLKKAFRVSKGIV